MHLPALSLAFVCLVFACYVLSALLLRFGLGLSVRAVVVAALGELAWLSTCGWLASSGYLVSDVAAMPPLLLRVIVLPALALVVAIAALPATGAALDHARTDWLVSAQAFRLPLELILHGLFVAGALPRRLTFAGANLDIATGALALLLGYLMHKRRARPAAVWAFNALGLCLLSAIVVMAMLSAPTPMQVWDDPPTLTLPFHVPFVWLPGYLVPLALLLHLLSLRALWRRRGHGAEAVAMPGTDAA